MLARLRSKLMILAMVGTAWLGSHGGCDGGGMYTSFGSVYDTVGGYFWVDDYDYGYEGDPFWGGGYTYEPYLGEYYDGYYEGDVYW